MLSKSRRNALGSSTQTTRRGDAPMKRAFARAAVIGLALVALVAVEVSAASAQPARTTDGRSLAANPKVTFVEAGAQDFSSADVFYFVDLMKKNGIDVNFQVIPDAATGLQHRHLRPVRPLHRLASDRDPRGRQRRSARSRSSRRTTRRATTSRRPAGHHAAEPRPGRRMAIDTPGSAGQLSAEIGIQKAGIDPQKHHTT